MHEAFLAHRFRRDKSRTKQIYAANKCRIPCHGSVDVEFEYYGRRTPTRVLVAEGLHENLLISTADQKKMGLLHEDYPRPIFHSETTRNIMAVPDSTALPADIARRLDALIEKYADVFGDDPTKLLPMKGPPMHIKLKEGIHIK